MKQHYSREIIICTCSAALSAKGALSLAVYILQKHKKNHSFSEIAGKNNNDRKQSQTQGFSCSGIFSRKWSSKTRGAQTLKLSQNSMVALRRYANTLNPEFRKHVEGGYFVAIV